MPVTSVLDEKHRMSPLRAWLQLLRAPNLFTVPGDPVAGYLLANYGAGVDGTLWLTIGACLLFYAAGLVLNDMADHAEDLRERPNRPLPSGAISRRAAFLAFFFMADAALVLCWFAGGVKALAVGGALLLSIITYNLWTKHWPVVGALNMGLCRALSVLVGACAGPLPFLGMAVPAALVIGIYIAAVTNLARHETRERIPVAARLLPVLVVALAALPIRKFSSMSPEAEPAFLFFGAALLWAFWLAVRMLRNPHPLPPMIGLHIRILLLLQAGLCWAGEPYEYGKWAAGILVAFLPLSHLAAKKFYAS